jgi:hypothetical protein
MHIVQPRLKTTYIQVVPPNFVLDLVLTFQWKALLIGQAAIDRVQERGLE